MRYLILILCWLWSCGGVGAQGSEPGLRLTLGQALEMADKGNPELHLSGQSVEVARTGVRIAGQRPNPTVGVGVPIGPAEQKQNILFTVPLETGGRRKARLTVAEDGIKEADLSRQQVRLGVLNQTRNAFVELAIAHAGLAQNRRDIEFFDRLVDAAQRRFEAGDVAQAEVIRAKFEREQARRLSFPAENRIQTALLGLNRVLGQPLDTSVEVVEDGWIFPSDEALQSSLWDLPPLTELRQMARSQRPDLALAAQQTETAKHRIDLAHANQAPALSLQGTMLYNHYLPAFTYMVGVQLEIPWGSDRGGEVDQAQSQRVEALLRHTSTLATADHAVQLAWTRYQAARQQLRHDLQVLRPQSERVLFLAEKIYQIGESDITQVLLAGQSVQLQRQLLLTDVAQLHQALGELELAINSTLIGGNP